MKFDLRRPCPQCPFRRGCLPEWLGRRRAEEIAGGLLGDQPFACHETTEVGGADPGREQHCAGAALLLEAVGKPNQLMRVAERCGVYDHRRLDRGADVFASPAAFITHHTTSHERDQGAPEPCAVAEIGCQAPAGYRVGAGGFAPNFDLADGQTEPCARCANPVCENCAVIADEGERVCLDCGERARENAA